MNTKNNTDIIHTRVRYALAALLTLGMTAGSASADVVVAEYDFDLPSTMVTNPASSDADAFTSAGNYVHLASPNTSTYSGISSSSDNAFFFSFQTGASASDSTLSVATSENDYHSFTLDVETSGATVSLDSLAFDQEFWNTHSTLTFSVSVLSSLDGFVTAGTNLGDFSIVGSEYTNGDTVDVGRDIDLSGISELQDLSTDVEFRFYFYDNSTATDRSHRIDNIVLTASSSIIPEPSSFALVFAFASLGATIFVRRGPRNTRV